jgi:carbamoyl-phosphate synthase large subunit
MDKTETLAAAAKDLLAMGFTIVATKGTASWLASNGVTAEPVAKVYEGRPNIVDRLKNDDRHRDEHHRGHTSRQR